MKLEFTREAEKLSDPAAASRVAAAISLSAGELTLVTTFGVRLVLESAGRSAHRAVAAAAHRPARGVSGHGPTHRRADPVAPDLGGWRLSGCWRWVRAARGGRRRRGRPWGHPPSAGARGAPPASPQRHACRGVASPDDCVP